jgi:hypothetical protein
MVCFASGGVRTRQHRTHEATLSKNSHEYARELCEEDFESRGKKAGHISLYNRNDRREDHPINEFQRLATEKRRPPEMSEVDRYTS